MEVKLNKIISFLWVFFPLATAYWRDRLERDINYLIQHRKKWETMLTEPPNMWLVPVDIIGTGPWLTTFPPDLNCGPCPESFNCDLQSGLTKEFGTWDFMPYHGSFKNVQGKQLRRNRILHPFLKRKPVTPFYFFQRWFCGIKQQQEWLSDNIAHEGILGYSSRILQFSEDGSTCGIGKCYTTCIAYDNIAQCKEGYNFEKYVRLPDSCISKTTNPGYQIPSEILSRNVDSVKCCKADNDLGECKEVQEYSSSRPHFECLVEEYSEKFTDESLIWVALEYCGPTDRRFLCCFGDKCYWTPCQRESDILEKERVYIEEEYDCRDGASNLLCEVAQGGATYYDLLDDCLKKHVYVHRPEPDGLDSFPIYSESCELLFAEEDPHKRMIEELLSFKGINNQRKPELGLNAAGLRNLLNDRY